MSAAQTRGWYFDPHSGGVKIPERTKQQVERCLHACFAKLGHDKSARLEVRFRGALCYIDAYREPDAELVKYWASRGENVQEAIASYREHPTRLGRLRHFDLNRWSYAFYTYSNERYEASTLNGEWTGTPEQGLEVGCVYLRD
ncbi:MAG: hypothetical protein Q8O29_19320 [Polaromonas sp.]|uniref:hypothetical protein n=1 Tax=Polaromonas sp. TaxID=1869339 RepID=UPI002733D9AE|nr:hypothetical protein [Polaromonas sp.]MDP2820384.1 hypothetical protein [Polaromonas sp.]